MKQNLRMHLDYATLPLDVPLEDYLSDMVMFHGFFWEVHRRELPNTTMENHHFSQETQRTFYGHF